MNKLFFILSILCLTLYACQTKDQEIADQESNATSKSKEESRIPLNNSLDLSKKGEYLVTVGGCHDCHSPKVFTAQGPVPDESRLLSGHPSDMPVASYPPGIIKDWVLFNAHNTAIAGPWGVSFSANITSDDTGVGLWKEEQFIKAMREGKYKGLDGSRPLLPPMPWPNFAKMTDEDLKAIFAYLKSTKPVRNVVPAPIPPAQLSMK